MSQPIETAFLHLKQLLDQSNSEATLEYLASYFLQSKQYSELFEIRKIQIRERIGLPLDFQQDVQQLTADQQRKMEDELLAACQEIGSLLIDEGDIAQGWLYLQPLMDRDFVQQAIESIDVNDENVDQVIEIALYQWAAPEFGYRLVLEQQGTCNGITFFDTQANYQTPDIRAKLSEVLINHIYQEVRNNILATTKEATTDDGNATLENLIKKHPEIFANCGHHLDVTHLASAARIARFCQSKTQLQQALELCTYGSKLDVQLQYESEPPFEKTYSDHIAFFRGLLDIDTVSAVEHFQNKWKHLQGTEHEPEACSILIDLLVRTNQNSLAIDAFIQSNPNSEQEDVSRLISLASSSSDYRKLMDHFESRTSLLGFAISGLYEKLKT